MGFRPYFSHLSKVILSVLSIFPSYTYYCQLSWSDELMWIMEYAQLGVWGNFPWKYELNLSHSPFHLPHSSEIFTPYGKQRGIFRIFLRWVVISFSNFDSVKNWLQNGNFMVKNPFHPSWFLLSPLNLLILT